MFSMQGTTDFSGSDDSANSPTSLDDSGSAPPSNGSNIDRVLGHVIATPNLNMKLPLLPPSPPTKFKSRNSRYRNLGM